MPNTPCTVCVNTPPTSSPPATRRSDAFAWRTDNGLPRSDHAVRRHLTHVKAELKTAGQELMFPAEQAAAPFEAERTVETAQNEFVADAEETPEAWLRAQGVEVPPGYVGGTIKIGDNWWRFRPQEDETAAVIQQAEPVNMRIHIAAQLPSRRLSHLHPSFHYGDAQIGWSSTTSSGSRPTTPPPSTLPSSSSRTCRPSTT